MIDGVLLLGGGLLAGLFGSLLGLGGGILIVPILTLGFGLPLIQAVGVSLVAVIVTSGAASGVYLERRVANLRLGMTLELFTAMGALVGGLVAFLVPERILELVLKLGRIVGLWPPMQGRDRTAHWHVARRSESH